MPFYIDSNAQWTHSPMILPYSFFCLFDLQNQNFTHVYPCLKVVPLCLYKRPHLLQHVHTLRFQSSCYLTSAQPYFLLSSFLKLCIIIVLQIRCKNKTKMVTVCTVKGWFDLELFVESLKYKKHTTVEHKFDFGVPKYYMSWWAIFICNR